MLIPSLLSPWPRPRRTAMPASRLSRRSTSRSCSTATRRPPRAWASTATTRGSTTTAPRACKGPGGRALGAGGTVAHRARDALVRGCGRRAHSEEPPRLADLRAGHHSRLAVELAPVQPRRRDLRLGLREFAPPEQRLRSVIGRLNGVPGVVAAAKENLKMPPRVHTETAILQIKGTVRLVKEQLEPLAKQVPALEKEFRAAQAGALSALEGYQEWLEKDLLPALHRRVPPGRRQVPQEVALRARFRPLEGRDPAPRRGGPEGDACRHARRGPAALAEALSRQAAPGRSRAAIKAVLDEAARKHPGNETVIAQASRDLAEVTTFVRERGIVTMLDEPLEIAPTPEFQRGVAVASCSPPGPLEKNAKTFYYISPTPRTGRHPASSRSSASTTTTCCARSPSTRRCPATTSSSPTPTASGPRR